MNKQIEEMNRPRNEELFNNLDKQYREIAKIQEQEKQIDIIEADIKTGMRDMEEVNPKVYKGLNYRTAAKHLEAIGYRKQEWISVDDRLPGKDEYLTHSSDGLDTLKRITIAYMTDTIEYTIGCYDGYKWLNQLGNRVIKDVIAWKPFDKYEPPKMKGGESDA